MIQYEVENKCTDTDSAAENVLSVYGGVAQETYVQTCLPHLVSGGNNWTNTMWTAEGQVTLRDSIIAC